MECICKNEGKNNWNRKMKSLNGWKAQMVFLEENNFRSSGEKKGDKHYD